MLNYAPYPVRNAFPIAALLTLVALPAAGQSVQVASQREGVAIVATSDLPTNPNGAPEASICGGLNELHSPAAGRVAEAGWGVTNEYEEGGLTYVSFVGRTTQGTSGSCLLEDGNVGIFRGEELLALVYADPAIGRSVGTLMGLQNGGVRIFDGDYLSAPLADLKVHADELALVRTVADRDGFCNRPIEVPSLYGLPIHQARILLMDEGWVGIPAQDLNPEDYAYDIAQGEGGLPEIQGCSGTGFGYCSFAYDYNDGAARLSVTTAGEWPEGSSPSVVDFGAECD